MKRYFLLYFAVVVAIGWISPVMANEEKKDVVIGILAFRSKEQTMQEWKPLAEYLDRHIPERHFIIRPLSYEEFNTAAQKEELDFAFTNPEHYIYLSVRHHATRIVTLIRANIQHVPLREFGGVILVRSERHDLQTIEEVRGKRIAAVDPLSLGGYLAQSGMLLEKGIDVRTETEVHFTDMPHDKVIEELRSRRADAGFVRTGLLEKLIVEGKLTEGEFRVLNPRHYPAFPQAISTPLYPEWPFASFRKTDPVLANQVAVALLSLPYGSHVAQSAGYYGWSTPLAYEGVRLLMEKMRVKPFDTVPQFTLQDVVEKYALLIITLLIVAIVSAGVMILRMKLLTRALREQSYALKEEISHGKVAEKQLRQSASVFHNSQEAVIITDHERTILDVNEAFSALTGYARGEVIGKKPSLLRSGRHDDDFYAQMNRTLAEEGSWKGEIWNRKKNGEIFAEYLRIDAVGNDRGEVETYIGIASDITEEKRQKEQLEHMANYDPLTNLPNRNLYMSLAEQLLAFTKRKGSKAVVAFLDLDGFKEINDQHGHAIGDKMLKKVASRLDKEMRQSDIVARIGGDEFIIFLADIQNHHDTQALLERILESLREPFMIEGMNLNVGASIGATFYPDDENPIDVLIRHADAAMYRSKEAGRNRITYYDPEWTRKEEGVK